MMVFATTKFNPVLGQATVATNAIGTSDYIGSSNANNLLFKDNGNLYMTLQQSNGFLGAGKQLLNL